MRKCPFSSSTWASSFPASSSASSSPAHLEASHNLSISENSHPDTTVDVDYAELNAPPMINYGVVYPQAILIFTITLLYSIAQPLILVFGALYFGIAYVVYKYKLLFGMSPSLSSLPFSSRVLKPHPFADPL